MPLPISNQPPAIIVRTKNIDYTPDLTSSAYWDTHHIAVVRITGAEQDSSGKRRITWQEELQLSGARVDPARTVPEGHFWFGNDPASRPRLTAGDRLLVFYPVSGPLVVAAYPLSGLIEQIPRVQTIQRIAALRSRKDATAALGESVFDANQAVAVYALQTLLAQPRVDLPDQYPQRLQRLRGQQTKPAVVRVLADKLLQKTLGRGPTSPESYAWVRSATSAWKGNDWSQAKPFVTRLLEFPDHRAETVTLLTQLAKDPTKDRSLRIASYSALEEPELFRFSNPDQTSDRLFDTLVELARDPDPQIRNAASALIHNVTVQTSESYRPRYLKRAKQTLAQAEAAEDDLATKHQYEYYLGLLSRLP